MILNFLSQKKNLGHFILKAHDNVAILNIHIVYLCVFMDAEI